MTFPSNSISLFNYFTLEFSEVSGIDKNSIVGRGANEIGDSSSFFVAVMLQER